MHRACWVDLMVAALIDRMHFTFSVELHFALSHEVQQLLTGALSASWVTMVIQMMWQALSEPRDPERVPWVGISSTKMNQLRRAASAPSSKRHIACSVLKMKGSDDRQVSRCIDLLPDWRWCFAGEEFYAQVRSQMESWVRALRKASSRHEAAHATPLRCAHAGSWVAYFDIYFMQCAPDV
jgi:hypothetical protein